MYNLFNKLSNIGQGYSRPSDWPYIQGQLKRNLDIVTTYFRENPTAVESSHFLVRLLHSITVPKSQNIERYYNNVDAMAMNLSMALKMTSPLHYGSIFNGVFYGKGNSEILIANTDPFDYNEAILDWENLRPVEVLRHPMSDLCLKIPDGHNVWAEEGIAVININILMLAVMYRSFRLNENYITGDRDSQKSIMQFIRMYVLPNMLYSHLDYALFNRFNNHLSNKPMGDVRKKHPFYLVDMSKRVDNVYVELLKDIQRANRDFATMLKSIPVITSKNLEEALLLPDFVKTRQIVWALTVARLPATVCLFKLATDSNGSRNQTEINIVLRNSQLIKYDNLLKVVLPRRLYTEVSEDVDFIDSYK